MSSLAVNAITDASGGTTASINGYTPSASNMTGRNRIINGAMMIDQRNAGASVTPASGQYLIDRWHAVVTQASKISAQQNAGSVTPPAAFSNYQGITSLSAYSVLTGDYFALRQYIEGFNVSDLGWGTASAQAITVSFLVRSSLTGNFGGNIANSGFNRSYPFSYTINAANTWEKKSITIPGDTSGTWLTNNNIGMALTFGLGYGASLSGTANVWNAGTAFMPTGATSVVGTSGATFYITGVQLEVGSTASEFEHRQYGHELALCQRYYQTFSPTQHRFFTSTTATSGVSISSERLAVEMRSTPSVSQAAGVTTCTLVNVSANTSTSQTLYMDGLSKDSWRFYPGGTSTSVIYVVSNVANIIANAEF